MSTGEVHAGQTSREARFSLLFGVGVPTTAFFSIAIETSFFEGVAELVARNVFYSIGSAVASLLTDNVEGSKIPKAELAMIEQVGHVSVAKSSNIRHE